MTRRDVIRLAIEGKRPPYVPWSFSFTHEARENLEKHFGMKDLDPVLHGHIVGLGEDFGIFEDLGNDRLKDMFGVVWNRSVDKDIGVVEGCVLPEPTLKGYRWPDPLDRRLFDGTQAKIDAHPDRFRTWSIGFSLFERAWTLRGMENLMMDFHENPEFVRELLNAIADWNIEQIRGALKFDIDAIHFGDDWGQQHGLLTGPWLWREFIKPVLHRMYREVHEGGRFVSIHCCGDVDELFDDLVAIGVNCFNPFQPEVMDVISLFHRYRGRLAFLGGLSTQRTLPYGTVEDVRRETRTLLDLGRDGGYIFSPAHAVEGDVSVENMLAFIELAQSQPGFVG